MATIWYALLGLFFATYLVLGGYDYGVGVSLARSSGPGTRRQALATVGPFFLGNEVWLVASLGILFGAFPMLEGELLSGLYPAVALALAGVVTVTAGVQLRSRPSGERARTRWDRVVVAGSALAALGWGAVLAGLLQGVPLAANGRVTGVGDGFTPFAGAGALALLALVAVHGGTFLALRLPAAADATTTDQAAATDPTTAAATTTDQAAAAGQAARYANRLVPVALVALAAATAVGLASERVRQTVQQPLVALALPVLLAAVLLTVRVALRRRRPRLAFAASALALALPIFGVAAATWPYALVSSADPAASLTVTDAAASEPTLRLLSVAAVPLLPVLLGFQLMCWWAFRGRLDSRAPVYW